MIKKIIKEKLFYSLIILSISIITFIYFWKFINLYLSRSKAATTSAILSIFPSNTSLNINETKEFQLLMQFSEGKTSEKIDYLKVIVNFPKEYLELADYVNTVDSGLGRQIRVDNPSVANSTGKIVIELGAIAPGFGPSTHWDGTCIECDIATSAGLKLVLTVRNNGPSSTTPPRDLLAYQRFLGQILDRYHPAVLAVENEENSTLFYTGTPDEYAEQLKVACQVAHQKGILCTNGGLVATLVAFLVYDHYLQTGQLIKARDFAARVFTPEMQKELDSPQAKEQISKGKALLAAYPTAGVDYVNFHWYFADTQALEEAVSYLKAQTSLPVITNEVGQFTDDPNQTTAVMSKIVELDLPIAAWFGLDGPKARGLVNLDGSLRPTGEAFKKFIEARFVLNSLSTSTNNNAATITLPQSTAISNTAPKPTNQNPFGVMLPSQLVRSPGGINVAKTLGAVYFRPTSVFINQTGLITIAKIKFKGKNAGSGQILIDDSIQIVNNNSEEITQVRRNNSQVIVNSLGSIPNQTPIAIQTLTPTLATTPTPRMCDDPCSDVKIPCPLLNDRLPCIPTTTLSPISPKPNVITLNLNLKFQGIVNQCPASDKKIKARVKLKSGGIETNYQQADFTCESGKWKGTVSFNMPPTLDRNVDAFPVSYYTVFIKGEKHLQKKICDQVPQESRLGPGTYNCRDGQITLDIGENNLDFTGILNLYGDLPVAGEQDGVINSLDSSYIRNNLGKNDPEVLAICDGNLDGKCDTQDWSMLIMALSIKGDEL